MMEPLRVGIVGCGAISGNYLQNARNFGVLKVVGCADLNLESARARATEFGVPRVFETVDQLLASNEVDVVLNLTIPKVHGAISLAALARGKHVWTEKPLAVDCAEGRAVYEAAAKAGLRVGGAPDTFFGAGHQTARRLLDAGEIGRPVAAMAFMLSPGHEGWHQNPSFFYQPGGGPMFDMGPYYLTAMCNLFGPIRRVCGFTSIAIPERTITHKKGKTNEPGPLFGQKIQVNTPDHVAGVIEFHNGVVATIVTSFATRFRVDNTRQPIVVFGTEGTMQVPDPNGFDGPVLRQRIGQDAYEEAPVEHTTGYGRSVGLADMAYGLRSGRAHRGSAELVMHVLEAMQGFLDSSATGRAVEIKTPLDRPAALPTGLPAGQLDA